MNRIIEILSVFIAIFMLAYSCYCAGEAKAKLDISDKVLNLVMKHVEVHTEE